MIPITGDTYDIRDRLKALGCRWDETAREWSAPDETIRAEAQALADAEPWRKWREYMDTLVWAQGSFTTTAWEAGLNACSRGIPLEDAVREIRDRIVGAGGAAKPGWCERNVGRAYEKAEPPAARASAAARGRVAAEEERKALPKPAFAETKLSKFAAPWVDVVDAVWLADRSPLPPAEVSPDGFLRALYGQGEKIVIFDVFESQGQWMWAPETGFAPSLVDHREWEGRDKLRVTGPKTKPGKEFPATGPQGIWYLCNPVDGQFRQQNETDKWGRPKWSRRWEPCFSAWRYFAFESDVKGYVKEWVAAFVQLPLPIAAIYTSGGRSVHVLVRVDAESKFEFDQWRNQAKRCLIPLGADPGCMSAVRLTRLPGCKRELDKEGNPCLRDQRLLFLDPNPTSVPLIERAAVRDTLEPWARWVNSVVTRPLEETDESEVEELARGLQQLRGGAGVRRLLERLTRWRA